MNTTTVTASPQWGDLNGPSESHLDKRRVDWTDITFFLLLSVGAAYALMQYPDSMDYYEKIILVSAVPFTVWLGWLWRPFKNTFGRKWFNSFVCYLVISR